MIVFAEVEETWQEEYLTERVPDDEELEFRSGPAENLDDSLKQEARVLSPFIQSNLTAGELNEWNNLELISTRSTGFDHIDGNYCEEHDITVSNVPTYGENTVAEHTFALILSLSRRIHEAVERTRRGQFEMGGLRGFDLRDRTMGVIGTGHIGIHVIRMARGFGMDVMAYDVEHNQFMSELLSFDYVELDELLTNSDIVSLHVPLNEHTRHMLSKQELERMKDSALLVNTARGGLIDTEALLEMLQEDKLRGAGLDVLEGEEMLLSEVQLNEKEFSRDKLQQLIQNNELVQRDDVIFTPHMAYNSKEALERILSTTAENITNFPDRPTNVVTAE